jgi:hypothetical protein
MKDRADGGTVLSRKSLDSVSGGRDNRDDLDGVRTNETASIFEAVSVFGRITRRRAWCAPVVSERCGARALPHASDQSLDENRDSICSQLINGDNNSSPD